MTNYVRTRIYPRRAWVNIIRHLNHFPRQSAAVAWSRWSANHEILIAEVMKSTSAHVYIQPPDTASRASMC